MNISSSNHMSDIIPASASKQSSKDSHENKIHNQIVSLQGKMRDLAYNTEMSEEEKSDKKKKLKEQIQNLNNELKQYRIEKRRSETNAPQEENKNTDRNVNGAFKDETETGKAASDDDDSNVTNEDTENTGGSMADTQKQTDDSGTTLSEDEAEVMFSISNNKKLFANMEKIQSNLTGLMRTAESEEDKLKLQKKIDSVSDIIGGKAAKTADKLANLRKEEQDKKDKIRKMRKEQEARKANMKAAVPKTGKSVFKDSEDGKVLLTRKKS